jgi:hypothetical protein
MVDQQDAGRVRRLNLVMSDLSRSVQCLTCGFELRKVVKSTPTETMGSPYESQFARTSTGGSMSRPEWTKRPLALVTFAIVALEMASAQVLINQPPTIQPGPPVPAWVSIVNAWVSYMTALAWPIATLAIAVAFRRPLADLLTGMSTRITKLSVFKVEFELSVVPTPAPTALLDEVRDMTVPAKLNDSYPTTLQQELFGDQGSIAKADFAVINLGSGTSWLTSRLFIAAAMLEKIRDIKVIVFLENTPTTQRRFVAIADVRELIRALGKRYPWLEVALARANLKPLCSGYGPSNAKAPDGAVWLPDPLTYQPHAYLDQDRNAKVVNEFIGSLQERSAVGTHPSAVLPTENPMEKKNENLKQEEEEEEEETFVMLRYGRRERSAWVTRDLLVALLPEEAFDLWADAGRDAPPICRSRAVLRRAAPFVALVQGDREYWRLTNRTTLLEQIAVSLGEEPESRHV